MTDAVNDGSQPSASTPPQGGTPAPAAGNAANLPGTSAAPEGDQDRNWKNLRSDRDYWRDRATQLETTPTRGAASEATPAPPVEAPTKKTLADFAFNDVAYSDYLREEMRTTAAEETRKTIEAEREKDAAAKRRETFDARTADYAKANPTFHEAVSNPRFVQSPALMAEMQESDIGPQIAHHLANDLELTNRLNRMSPTQVAREVGKIEERLRAKNASATPPTAITPPPAPPAQIGATGDPGIAPKPPEKMSDEDWWKDRERKNKRKK